MFSFSKLAALVRIIPGTSPSKIRNADLFLLRLFPRFLPINDFLAALRTPFYPKYFYRWNTLQQALASATAVSAADIYVQVGGNTSTNASLVFQPQLITAVEGDIVFFNCTSTSHRLLPYISYSSYITPQSPWVTTP